MARAIESKSIRADRDGGGTVTIEFRDSTYRIDGVPPEVWHAWQQADSPGRFYNLNVREQYPAERVG